MRVDASHRAARVLTALAALAWTECALRAQDGASPRTFGAALAAVSTKDGLEEWLQHNVPGLISYNVSDRHDPSQPPTLGSGQEELDYESTTVRRYSWQNCTLTVQEAERPGIWFEPGPLLTTAEVAMADVESVSSGVMTGEGPVGLSLKQGEINLKQGEIKSWGNARSGSAVKLLARHPMLVARVLLKYSQVCKGHSYPNSPNK